MDWNWLWQGLVANAVYAVLLILGGIVLAVLKKTRPNWAGPALYGLSGCALVAVLIFTVTGHAVFSRQQPETTPQNVEQNLRAWADSFQLGVTKMPPQTDVDFGLAISLKSGNPVEIRQLKQIPSY